MLLQGRQRLPNRHRAVLACIRQRHTQGPLCSLHAAPLLLLGASGLGQARDPGSSVSLAPGWQSKKLCMLMRCTCAGRGPAGPVRTRGQDRPLRRRRRGQDRAHHGADQQCGQGPWCGACPRGHGCAAVRQWQADLTPAAACWPAGRCLCAGLACTCPAWAAWRGCSALLSRSADRHLPNPGGYSVFAGVGERTREGNDLYKEMIESVRPPWPAGFLVPLCWLVRAGRHARPARCCRPPLRAARAGQQTCWVQAVCNQADWAWTLTPQP